MTIKTKWNKLRLWTQYTNTWLFIDGKMFAVNGSNSGNAFDEHDRKTEVSLQIAVDNKELVYEHQ